MRRLVRCSIGSDLRRLVDVPLALCILTLSCTHSSLEMPEVVEREELDSKRDNNKCS